MASTSLRFAPPAPSRAPPPAIAAATCSVCCSSKAYSIGCSFVQESTQEAEVAKFAERSGEGGLPIYEFEYVVDSSQGGMKRIFSTAFVASKKLYLLNIVHSDKPESPLDS